MEGVRGGEGKGEGYNTTSPHSVEFQPDSSWDFKPVRHGSTDGDDKPSIRPLGLALEEDGDLEDRMTCDESRSPTDSNTAYRRTGLKCECPIIVNCEFF